MTRAEDLAFMQQALALAAQAGERGEVPVGALVVDETGHVIGTSANNRNETADPTGHAEIIALRQAALKRGRWNLSGCTLYVTLEPCPMCAGACIQSRVSRVVYGAKDPRGGCCGSLYDLFSDRRFNHRPRCESGLLADACRQLLADFFQARRKKAKN